LFGLYNPKRGKIGVAEGT